MILQVLWRREMSLSDERSSEELGAVGQPQGGAPPVMFVSLYKP